jgi:hypothetical protein
MNKETTDHSEAQEIYNETSNTAAGINTHKNHGRSGPLDMVSGAVEEMVDEVRQTRTLINKIYRRPVGGQTELAAATKSLHAASFFCF